MSQKTIGVVATTAAGHRAAQALAAAWPTEVRLYGGAAELRLQRRSNPTGFNSKPWPPTNSKMC